MQSTMALFIPAHHYYPHLSYSHSQTSRSINSHTGLHFLLSTPIQHGSPREHPPTPAKATTVAAHQNQTPYEAKAYLQMKVHL